MQAGVLVLVVGPSGAGKDTLLETARRTLRDAPSFRFVRRVITRIAEAGGEEHEAVTPEEFATRRFALSWHIHGLSYGIPDDITRDLACGRVVIANVSRAIVADAASRFPVRVIEVTASPDILAARLAERGREGASARTERLARRVDLPDGVWVETVSNDASLAEGAARFFAALNRAASGAPPAGKAAPPMAG